MKVAYVCFAVFVVIVILCQTGNMPEFPTMTETVSGSEPVKDWTQGFERSLNPSDWMR